MTPATAIVPARLQSTRLPGKPLADINGKPMVVRVMEQVATADFSQVVAAVDDEAVQDVVEAAGFKSVMTSIDHVSGSDRVNEVADQLKLGADEIVINVQGDEPLIPTAVLNHMINAMADDAALDWVTFKEPILRVEDYLNPNVVKVVCADTGDALYFSRAPIPHVRDRSQDSLSTEDLRMIGASRHIGIYGFRRSALAEFVSLGRNSVGSHAALENIEMLEQLRWLQAGHRIHVLEAPEAVPGGIDTPEDLERVRQLMT